MLQFLLFLAIVFTALALVPGGAHLLEMANKLKLARADYFVVQSIYRGWAASGIVVLAALAANLGAAFVEGANGEPLWPSATAAMLILATLIVFFRWTQPVNKATRNWSAQPEDWEKLRSRWEVSHAVNAVLTFTALCFATIAAIA